MHCELCIAHSFPFFAFVFLSVNFLYLLQFRDKRAYAFLRVVGGHFDGFFVRANIDGQFVDWFCQVSLYFL